MGVAIKEVAVAVAVVVAVVVNVTLDVAIVRLRFLTHLF